MAPATLVEDRHDPIHAPVAGSPPSSPLASAPIARALASLAVLLALLLLVTGCGGHGSTSGPRAAGLVERARASSARERPARPDPGAGVPKVGQCSRMTAAQVARVACPGAGSAASGQHTTVVAYVGYAATAVTPLTPVAERRAAGQAVCQPAYRALSAAPSPTAPQSLLTWTLFTPGQAELEARRPLGPLRRARAQRRPPGAAARDQPDPGRRRAGELRVCQTKAGVDVSCAEPHFFRVEAVFQAPGATYPGVTLRWRADRCCQLIDSLGGYFQPPSRAGWAAVTASSAAWPTLPPSTRRRPRPEDALSRARPRRGRRAGPPRCASRSRPRPRR